MYEPSSKFSFTVKDSTSEGVHEFTFTSQGDGTLMTRNVTSQWSLMMWPVAMTLGHWFIGKPAMRKAFDNLKGKLE